MENTHKDNTTHNKGDTTPPDTGPTLHEAIPAIIFPPIARSYYLDENEDDPCGPFLANPKNAHEFSKIALVLETLTDFFREKLGINLKLKRYGQTPFYDIKVKCKIMGKNFNPKHFLKTGKEFTEVEGSDLEFLLCIRDRKALDVEKICSHFGAFKKRILLNFEANDKTIYFIPEIVKAYVDDYPVPFDTMLVNARNALDYAFERGSIEEIYKYLGDIVGLYKGNSKEGGKYKFSIEIIKEDGQAETIQEYHANDLRIAKKFVNLLEMTESSLELGSSITYLKKYTFRIKHLD